VAVSSSTIPLMPPQELDTLMTELKAWCKEEHGRQKAVAEELGVTEQLVSNWIARRKTPGLENYLKLQALLKKRRHR
jgi:transcriptional regulator with XRE-family HTH domain